jgi:hypothetical protein
MIRVSSSLRRYGSQNMGGNVARLPSSTTGDGVPPSDVYKIAVDDYHFQAQFNWSRTQYLLAFDAAILAIGAGLSSRPGHSAGYAKTISDLNSEAVGSRTPRGC